MKRCPIRCAARAQLRFSMSFYPFTMNQAHGCRTDSALVGSRAARVFLIFIGTMPPFDQLN
jgi:hypothetical protein